MTFVNNSEYFNLSIKHSLNNNLKFNGSDLFSIYDLTFYQYYYLIGLGLLKLDVKVEDILLSMFGGDKSEVDSEVSREVKEEMSKYKFKANNNSKNLKDGKQFSSLGGLKSFLGESIQKEDVSSVDSVDNKNI